jgi:AcrR family transcriptional regulator
MVTGDPAVGKQCLMEQARHLFFAHGYHGVSIRDIVQACGLSNAALYYHFGSKQDLYVQVIREFVATIAQQVQDAGAGRDSCRERLARMAEMFLQLSQESQSELQTLLRDLTECEGEDIQRLIPEIAGRIPILFASVLEEGIAGGEVRAMDAQRVSVVLMGTINSLVARRMYMQAGVPLADDVDLVINILFEGIGV